MDKMEISEAMYELHKKLIDDVIEIGTKNRMHSIEALATYFRTGEILFNHFTEEIKDDDFEKVFTNKIRHINKLLVAAKNMFDQEMKKIKESEKQE